MITWVKLPTGLIWKAQKAPGSYSENRNNPMNGNKVKNAIWILLALLTVVAVTALSWPLIVRDWRYITEWWTK